MSIMNRIVVPPWLGLFVRGGRDERASPQTPVFPALLPTRRASPPGIDTVRPRPSREATSRRILTQADRGRCLEAEPGSPREALPQCLQRGSALEARQQA